MSSSSPNSSFAPFTPTLPTGYVLRDYIIEEVLGQGGFGITYLAKEEMTDYPVVIKENYPSLFAYRDPISGELRPMHKCEESYRWALESFEKEARTLRKLPKHTNLVHVTGVFRALNTAYIVMEPIDGKNLAELYPQGSQVEPQLLEDILCKLLCALEPLHKQGIIHRDIKPGNIMLTKAGEPVLIDFGAARPMEGTHTATRIGTREYAPPEQLELAEYGENAEKQSPQPHWDLYALGCTCHQLITGYVPVSGARTLSERPELQGLYSSALLASIDKAHEKDPADRWQSAQEWLAAIAPARNTSPIPTPPPAPKITKQAAQAELANRGIFFKKYDKELLTAAKKGNTELINLLIAAGADVNKVHGWWIFSDTPLTGAAVNGKAESIKCLLQAPGIDVNKGDKDGNTPLYQAAYHGHTECVKLLIAAGADVNKAYEYSDNTPLSWAARNGHTECVKLLIAAGADVNKADKEGKTPLYRAAGNGHTECVKLLIDAGADVNKADEDGWTPLYCAAYSGRTECVKLLIDAKADVNKANNSGRTPLRWAAENGHAECVKLLLATGADVNKADEDGETPLHMAAYKGHTECVKLLIAAGADVNKANEYGYTPLYWAAWKGHTECAELLRNCGGKRFLS